MAQDTKSGPLAFTPLTFAPLSFGAAESGGVGGIPEAPLDGQAYARKMAAWAAIPDAGGNDGVSDAPSDGQQYGRQDGAWTPILHEGEGGGIPDAPSDDMLYGRKNGAWAKVPDSGSGGATGLCPEIIAGTTTPVTVGESAAAVTLFTIPGSVIDAAVNSVLTIDILGHGALDAGYRELQLGYPSFSFGVAHVNGAKSVCVRFSVYVGENSLYRLPTAVSPYMASTSATGIYGRVAGREMTIRVTPGETGTLTMNACIVTKWRAPE